MVIILLQADFLATKIVKNCKNEYFALCFYMRAGSLAALGLVLYIY